MSGQSVFVAMDGTESEFVSRARPCTQVQIAFSTARGQDSTLTAHAHLSHRCRAAPCPGEQVEASASGPPRRGAPFTAWMRHM
ncbi:hypothetical protein SF83666_c24120 [Sinorhizobium fredii CCBAU 83666]|nr:hypothetical protein SF83666_c24120 [Sinorhizobium fredii CCBAU 83666]